MSQTENIYAQVKASFGPNAKNYTQSSGHGNYAILAELVAKVAPNSTDRVLDIGTGAGHTAIAFAPHVASVVALDLTPQMLEQTARNAAAKNITNLTTQQSPAENLPFPDASFEVVVCRLTTHHFANLAQAVGEMARVLTPGGKLVIVDTCVPEDKELDREINEIELLRDPAHVRNYSESEWRGLVEKHGLQVTNVEHSYYFEESGNGTGKMNFDIWTHRIGTTPDNIVRLRQMMQAARPELAQILQIEIDTAQQIWFSLPLILVIATR